VIAGSILATGATLAAADEPLEEIVVTATRQEQSALRTPFSIGRVGADTIELVAPTHHIETLNRVPGTMIQRGSGQESLTAIRSPVLTGPGACGVFLFLENGIPIRPVGFCNVNEMFEINTEQAAAIEVLRGPGTALYGSNAMHGTVNVLQAPAEGYPLAGVDVDIGPADYRRLELAGRIDATRINTGIQGFYTHDGGWRDDSGYDEAKINVTTSTVTGRTPMRFDLAATILNQDTAGFIRGKDAYEDEDLITTNPNPEAYRDASAVRLTGLIQPATPWAARLELRPYLRSSRMEFLQHFLLGQPLERNGQESGGLMSALYWDSDSDWSVTAGLDLELGHSFLQQEQDRPTTDGSDAANGIRPQGKQYDYAVDSRVAAIYVHAERRFAQRWRLAGGLRAEYVSYDYDNRMVAGNSDENGEPCGFGGCLYYRPGDRTDSFFNIAPKISLSYDATEHLSAYLAAGNGFRPPEMTELYRLQRTQSADNLDSEQLDSLELGLKGSYEKLVYSLAAFYMQKSNVILRESNGFLVDNGRTSHRGIEYEFAWRAWPTLTLTAGGTYARHEYEFSSEVTGGETIIDGNEIDTAPRDIYRAALWWEPIDGLRAEAEWNHVGAYWLDASNEHRYTGHNLLNLRAAWRLAPDWKIGARLNNVLDTRYADRADYAFGSYRYFPGRGRALFVDLSWRL